MGIHLHHRFERVIWTRLVKQMLNLPSKHVFVSIGRVLFLQVITKAYGVRLLDEIVVLLEHGLQKSMHAICIPDHAHCRTDRPSFARNNQAQSDCVLIIRVAVKFTIPKKKTHCIEITQCQINAQYQELFSAVLRKRAVWRTRAGCA